MDYEKAYKEAIKRAKSFRTPDNKDVAAYIFPVLAESEDEKIRKKIIATIHLYYGEPLEDEAKEMIAWLEKQGKQKPAEWSEEDKMQLDAAIHLVSSTGHIETANWLKSIKDRVLQQNITVTDEELAKAKKDAYNDALDKIEYHSGIWYLKKKNTRPQSTWKPSDEHMEYLAKAITTLGNEGDCKTALILNDLRFELKKLKNE